MTLPIVGSASQKRKMTVKIKHVLFVAALAAILSATAVRAQSLGTEPEARAMLDRAIAELKNNQAAALEKFQKWDGGFHDRDLWVICFDTSDGKVTAHPNTKLMGKDIRAFKDREEVPVGQMFFDGVKEGTVSTVDFKMFKPDTTGPLVPVQAFITRVGNEGCFVIYYK
jgi:hypothetical protein